MKIFNKYWRESFKYSFLKWIAKTFDVIIVTGQQKKTNKSIKDQFDFTVAGGHCIKYPSTQFIKLINTYDKSKKA